MDKLLLVDGSNLLFQMFYGMPARILSKEGKPMQGTLGFVGALLKIIRMTNPSHLLVMFDGEYESDRRDLDKSYKSNRIDYSLVSEADSPFSQLPDIQRALNFMGIVWAETQTCEADDWMAAYAKAYGDRMEIRIASQDSDLFQLITDRVHILRYRGKLTTLCTPDWFHEKFSISPGSYAAYKSLTGDSADHIQGVPGVGPKTASALMQQFSGLDSLLSSVQEIQKPSVREAVRQHADRIKRNHRLICLLGSEPMPFHMEELTFSDPGYTTREILSKIGL